MGCIRMLAGDTLATPSTGGARATGCLAGPTHDGKEEGACAFCFDGAFGSNSISERYAERLGTSNGP